MARRRRLPHGTPRENLACASVLSPDASPSTRHLPGQTRTPRTYGYSSVLNATSNPYRTDTADVAVQQTPRSSDFLNRVHKFDSCRGHLGAGPTPTLGDWLRANAGKAGIIREHSLCICSRGECVNARPDPGFALACERPRPRSETDRHESTFDSRLGPPVDHLDWPQAT